MEKIQIKRLTEEAKLPVRAHPTDAGMDVFALNDTELLYNDQPTIVKTGIAIAVPPGFVGIIKEKSSMARDGIRIGAGVIDAAYRGEVGVVMQNVNYGSAYQVTRGQKIAQLLIVPIVTPPIEEVTELDQTDRGTDGFGSTGKF